MAYPWEGKLAGLGLDDEDLAKVNAFLSGDVQPYITQLEQSRAPQEAADLYANFQTDPLGTFKEVFEELVSEDVLTPEAVAELFEIPPDPGGEGDPPTGDQPVGQLAPEQLAEALEALGLHPDAVKAATESTLNADANDEYDDFVDALVEEHPEYFKHPRDAEKDVREWIDPYMLSADGDPEQAFQLYKAHYDDAFGDPTATDAPDPPAAIGGEGAAGETPTQKEYGDIGEAVDDWFAERRAAEAPPAVGSV